MSKHTPGPWRVDADGVLAGTEGGFKPFGGCGCCGSPWMNADDEMTALADARLIAAAPELLEALKAVLAVLEILSPLEGNETRKAYRAIAKAEGVQL